MPNFPTAGNAEALKQIIDQASNEEYEESISHEAAERIVELAEQRTKARGDDAFSQEKDFVFASTWWNMLWDKLGGHDGKANTVALGRIDFEVSEGKNAWLVKDAVAVTHGYMTSGDGRMNKVEEVDLTDTDHHEDPDEMWWPHDYATTIELTDSLVKSDPKASDAM